MLDELAAAIIVVDANDEKELIRIRESLESIRDTQNYDENARHLAGEAASWIETLISKQCEDTEEVLENIRQMVSSIQMLAEPNEIEIAQPVKSSEIIKTIESKKDVVKSEFNQESKDKESVLTQNVDTNKNEPEENPLLEEDPELLKEFINESLDHIQNSEASLLNLETNPSCNESLNAIFRAFHTIKGTAGFLNLTKVQTLAHRSENLLDRARKGEIKLVGGFADLVLEANDMLKEMITVLEGIKGCIVPSPPPEYGTLIDKLTNPEKMGITEEISDIDLKAPRVGDILVATGKISRTKLERTAKKQGEEPIGEALINSGEVTAKDVGQALRIQKRINEAQSGELTVRVGTDRLDNLINMVGELVITQAQVAQNEFILSGKDRKLSTNVSHLSKIMRELQDVSMSLRMVPLRSTFQKMARLVRDLSHKSGKIIGFITEGEDTEIDRNMVELLNDPLVHMVRNAIDHGIETPTERQAAGKSETGTITLRAYHTAGKVVIELHDDGKGLDAEKIKKKAISKGLITSDKELTESDIHKLIFAAGFSTAEQVTDISGRGVGMDVVRKNIESMRGRVEISSTKGKGSIFTIRIPLTLAIIEGMALKVGSEQYIVPTLNVQQSFKPDRSAISTVHGKGEMVMLRGNLLPIFRLHQLFNVPNAIENPTEGLLLVIEYEGQSCTILADSLLGQRQVVVKSLGQGVGDIDGVAGAAILGDGRVGLILDVSGIMRIARGETTDNDFKTAKCGIKNKTKDFSISKGVSLQ